MKTINLLDTIKQDIQFFNNMNNFAPIYLILEEDKNNVKDCEKWYILYNNNMPIWHGPLKEINIAVKSLIKYRESL